MKKANAISQKRTVRSKGNRKRRKSGIIFCCAGIAVLCILVSWKPAGHEVWGRERTGGREARRIYEENSGLLILVNKENPLKAEYDADLRDICSGRLQASNVIYDDLVQMLEDADKAGYTYWIASAYRSRERQEELMERDIRENMQKGMGPEEARKEANRELMEPGYSEHETGLALDILCSENMNMDASQASEDGNRWLRENGWKYGFVLRYPEDKAEITQIDYEPWHFRYVGTEAAEYLWKNDLTLDEFCRRIE